MSNPLLFLEAAALRLLAGPHGLLQPLPVLLLAFGPELRLAPLKLRLTGGEEDGCRYVFIAWLTIRIEFCMLITTIITTLRFS